jgi:hypothetical protein
MANRIATHILKNSNVPSRPLPSVLLAGEPIVNTADGIVYFSGNSASSNNWVPAGTGGDANFFEAGSNLYDLQLRNRITKYEGISGAGLAGKFLSGTSTGFVLADIASIGGIDTYVTGFTYSNNVATVKQNQGQPDLTILIDSMTGLTVNGTLSATTLNLGTIGSYNGLTNVAGQFLSGTSTGFVLAPVSSIVGIDTFTTAFTYSNNVATIKRNQGQPDLTILIDSMTGLTVNGTLSATTSNFGTSNITTLNLTGGSITTAASNPNDIVNYSTLTGYSQTHDVYVTGGTYTAGTAVFANNTGGTFNVTGFSTGSTDTYVTGFTYSPTTNTFTIKQNQGQSDLPVQFNTVSGLTVSNLTSGRVVYVGGSGLLTDEAGFTYDAGTNTLSVPSDGSVSVGTGGLSVAGDAVIQGSLTVFGPSISAFTSQLYVEDNNITLNYNPTGNTTATSIGSGWLIQDGNGVNGGSVNLDIRAMNTFTGLTSTQVPSIAEYAGSTGYANRAWVTQLNDVVIRSTNVATPNGVRVLAEFDILDGGSY